MIRTTIDSARKYGNLWTAWSGIVPGLKWTCMRIIQIIWPIEYFMPTEPWRNHWLFPTLRDMCGVKRQFTQSYFNLQSPFSSSIWPSIYIPLFHVPELHRLTLIFQISYFVWSWPEIIYTNYNRTLWIKWNSNPPCPSLSYNLLKSFRCLHPIFSVRSPRPLYSHNWRGIWRWEEVEIGLTGREWYETHAWSGNYVLFELEIFALLLGHEGGGIIVTVKPKSNIKLG